MPIWGKNYYSVNKTIQRMITQNMALSKIYGSKVLLEWRTLLENHISIENNTQNDKCGYKGESCYWGTYSHKTLQTNSTPTHFCQMITLTQFIHELEGCGSGFSSNAFKKKMFSLKTD